MMYSEPFEFGTEVIVNPATGRIERTRFVVDFAQKCNGGGYRYRGFFPGAPVWKGYVYSDDITGVATIWGEADVQKFGVNVYR